MFGRSGMMASHIPFGVVSSAFSLSGTITLPSGITANDTILLYDLSVSTTSTPPSYAGIAGWTNVASDTDLWDGGTKESRASLFYRAGSPSLSGTSVTGMNGLNARMAAVVVRNGIDFSTFSKAVNTSGQFLSTIVLPSNGVADDFSIVFLGNTGSVGFTQKPATTTEVAPDSQMRFAYKIGDGTGTYEHDVPSVWANLYGFSFALN